MKTFFRHLLQISEIFSLAYFCVFALESFQFILGMIPNIEYIAPGWPLFMTLWVLLGLPSFVIHTWKRGRRRMGMDTIVQKVIGVATRCCPLLALIFLGVHIWITFQPGSAVQNFFHPSPFMILFLVFATPEMFLASQTWTGIIRNFFKKQS